MADNPVVKYSLCPGGEQEINDQNIMLEGMLKGTLSRETERRDNVSQGLKK